MVLLYRLRIEFIHNFLGDSECDEPTIFEPCVQVSTPFGESILWWLLTIQLEPLPPAPLPFFSTCTRTLYAHGPTFSSLAVMLWPSSFFLGYVGDDLIIILWPETWFPRA